MRVFVMTLIMGRPNEQCGGPSGVNYRLEKANAKYHYLNEVYHIYFDAISWEEGLLLMPGSNDLHTRLASDFKMLNSIFKFNDEDVFIYHDIHTAYYAKLLGMPQRRTLLVYHAQGSLYSEYISSHLESIETKRYMDEMTEAAMEWSKRVGFPSVGAMEALIETEPAVEAILDKKMVDILHNGCDIFYDNDAPEAVDIDVWKRICDCPYDLKLISVADLLPAKGVDTLPGFFADLGKSKSFMWIIVGSGPQTELISNLINEYGIQKNVIWIKNRIPNSDILKLMSKTNFYIMGHRRSIFDFSTIEAMHMGNIPVLTFVGGNKEMIVEDNGFYLTGDKEYDATRFIEYCETINLLHMKNKNIDIARRMFSEEAFLLAYQDAVKCLIEETSF